MRDLNKLTVAALKELLSARGLSSIGTKAELISRLMEADPSGTIHGWTIDGRMTKMSGILARQMRSQRLIHSSERSIYIEEREKC